MRLIYSFFLALLAASLPTAALAQQKRNDADFIKEKPAVGDTIPDVTVYDPSGKEVKTADLRGHHTVLVFGCLT